MQNKADIDMLNVRYEIIGSRSGNELECCLNAGHVSLQYALLKHHVLESFIFASYTQACSLVCPGVFHILLMDSREALRTICMSNPKHTSAPNLRIMISVSNSHCLSGIEINLWELRLSVRAQKPARRHSSVSLPMDKWPYLHNSICWVYKRGRWIFPRAPRFSSHFQQLFQV